ncbi:hypothetical protein [Nonomuraea longispora]|nr:hypothetical protein [Nonomuraea longispora]
MRKRLLGAVLALAALATLTWSGTGTAYFSGTTSLGTTALKVEG